ncbi:PadR family transcriptional regulator [Humibacter ginsenosidimutans]|uniref:Helix-turn-helix transcriptional regulator n=1 Tax=Humibacter ginsenosidimutans TaxID=2599293 RepID=A0A5B8M3M0_9MICO|nr:PadR family transcriptional regulator [Humibacter ginsenosidimutans]QDZ15207.1 helix-turn-helix transcriptional regulator [Humibacter ginsenosidimutans]
MTPAVFSHGRLRLYLLSLLDERPMHGYELIQALSDRFGGTYSPSAGTIYPRLSKLEEEGLVTKTTEGRKTVYSITDAGRAELRARASELDDIENEVTDSLRRMADEVRAGVNQAMKSLRADLAAAAREAKREAREAKTAGATASGTTAQGFAPDPRAESRLALREAEIVLNEFRQQVRADLRTATMHDGIPDAVVEHLRSDLARVRADLLARLSR